MRYPASEKLEIIKLVERSHLPAKQTLDRLTLGLLAVFDAQANQKLPLPDFAAKRQRNATAEIIYSALSRAMKIGAHCLFFLATFVATSRI